MPQFPERDESGPEKRNKFDLELSELPSDPGQRPLISSYNPNVRDEVHRAYLQMGPCQPRFHNFCKSKFGQQQRRFNPTWFNKYENWLEYSISKNAAYCLCCYLFRPEIGEQASGEIFTKNGFSNWKKLERLEEHVGSPNSAHNKVVGYCEDLMKQEQHVQTFFNKHSYQDRKYYRIRLFASIDVVRLLLEQGLAFRDIKKVTVKNAPGNNMLIAPSIQKDIVRACSIETTNAIIRDVGDALFSVLIDESRDASMKEQMAVVLQYVDKNGSVIECFIGLKHVTSTTAISLKEALDQLFSKHGLSISRLRGQGYDGASNMQGEFNGLRTLIMNENECAYYIHCFAHQLQLVIVAVAKKHDQVNSFLNVAANVVNHDIDVPNMNDIFLPWGRSRRKARKISNMHYFQVELFFAVLDLQLQELNNRFNEVNMELLLCLACLCPNDAFAAFDKDKLVRLAQFYPKDFSPIELMALKTQLQIYIMDMRSSTEFAGLKGISDLAKRMVETKKDKVYPLVYLSVTLALVLPVFTATVERTFSAMKFVKNELRNRMGDEWMNDNLIVYVEKDVFNSIDNESIAQCFHNMKSRREQL
ncbi:TTF-type domain-containing protein [Citrus sinensis]|uniref:TTF-type domain-containing protein n=1 Tax=Citrus sinensis TaxID=2711 RepID=A0ACB8N5T1_CITSI|nr:TTF-type domain-containing protein [Citrus sinensis]